MENFVIYDPFDDAQDMFMNYDLRLFLSIRVNLCRSFDYAQDMLIGNKHVWKNKPNFLEGYIL